MKKLQTNVKTSSEINKREKFKTKKLFPNVNTYHVTQTKLLSGSILLQYSKAMEKLMFHYNDDCCFFSL